MTSLPTHAVRRLAPPSWRDSRLILGVVLVLLAAVLGAKAVSAADNRTPVYVATRDLVPGDPVRTEDLSPVPAHLESVDERYFPSAAGAPRGLVVTRPVGAGELLPRAATAPQDDAKVQTLTVPVDASSVAGLARGGLVDVYTSPRRTPGDDAKVTARLLIARVPIAQTPDARGGFGSTSATVGVQVRVPSDRVTDVVTEITSGSQFVLVRAATAQGSP